MGVGWAHNKLSRIYYDIIKKFNYLRQWYKTYKSTERYNNAKEVWRHSCNLIKQLIEERIFPQVTKYDIWNIYNHDYKENPWLTRSIL